MIEVAQVLNNISIKIKLLGGVGLLVVALVGLVGVSLWGLSTTNDMFTEYRAEAGKTVAVTDVTNAFTLARMGALQFRLTPSDKAADTVATYTAQVRQDGTALRKWIKDPAQLAELKTLQTQVGAYAGMFEKVRDSQTRITAIFTSLEALGKEIPEKIARLVDAPDAGAARTQDLLASNARSDFLVGALHAERIARDPSQENFSLARESVARAHEAMTSLANEQADHRTRTAVMDVDTAISRYLDQLGELERLVDTRREANAGLLEIGPKILGVYVSMLKSSIENQSEIGPKTVTHINATIGEV